MKLPRRSFLASLFVAPFARRVKPPTNAVTAQAARMFGVKPRILCGFDGSAHKAGLEAAQAAMLSLMRNFEHAHSNSTLERIERSTRQVSKMEFGV